MFNFFKKRKMSNEPLKSEEQLKAEILKNENTSNENTSDLEVDAVEVKPVKPKTRGEQDKPVKCKHGGRLRTSKFGKVTTKVCCVCGKVLKKKVTKKKSSKN